MLFDAGGLQRQLPKVFVVLCCFCLCFRLFVLYCLFCFFVYMFVVVVVGSCCFYFCFCFVCFCVFEFGSVLVVLVVGSCCPQHDHISNNDNSTKRQNR